MLPSRHLAKGNNSRQPLQTGVNRSNGTCWNDQEFGGTKKIYAVARWQRAGIDVREGRDKIRFPVE